MKPKLSRRKLEKFSRMASDKADDYEFLLIALALASDGEITVSDDDIKRARDVVNDKTALSILRREDGISIAVPGLTVITT